MKCFQDLERTIPAVTDGDPVAVVDADKGDPLIQTIRSKRPRLVTLPYAAGNDERRAIEAALREAHGI